jgi:NitT/TauT family transport system ATP-binding protein
MSNDLITVEAVTKQFRTARGAEVKALSDVSFTVRAGEFVSIVGPSGCGKSTMLSIVAGLEPPTAGRVCVSGRPVTGPRRDISVVFQDPVLLPWRRVTENILLPAEICAPRMTKAYRERAAELIELVGLRGFEHSYPKELSGGMQQRCAIARSLMLEAPVLLMDEPFGALDALTREELNLEIQDIWMRARKTVILITHDINEAVLLSDRVVVMSSRPGTILQVFEVTQPRPRTFSAVSEGANARLAAAIREQLGVGRVQRARPNLSRETSDVG